LSLPSPPAPPTQGPTGPGATPPRRGLPGRVWWAIFIVLLAWNVFAVFGSMTSTSVEVPYSAFLALAKQANVDQVTFNGQALNGTFRHAVQWPPASAAPGSAAAASPAPAASTGSAQAAPATYTSFTTVVPPDGDPALLPILERKVSRSSPRTAAGARCCST